MNAMQSSELQLLYIMYEK